MNHPDALTLQSLHDGALAPAAAAEVGSHTATCARCAEQLAGLRALSAATHHWAEAVPALPDDFADLLLAKLEPASPARPVSPASPVTSGRVISLRRWAWPAMAVAAAALVVVGARLPRGPRDDTRVVSQEPIRVGEGNGGVKVTRVDVPGAQSFTVMQLPGVRPESLTAVVWIQDREEPGAPQ